MSSDGCCLRPGPQPFPETITVTRGQTLLIGPIRIHPKARALFPLKSVGFLHSGWQAWREATSNIHYIWIVAHQQNFYAPPRSQVTWEIKNFRRETDFKRREMRRIQVKSMICSKFQLLVCQYVNPCSLWILNSWPVVGILPFQTFFLELLVRR